MNSSRSSGALGAAAVGTRHFADSDAFCMFVPFIECIEAVE